MISQLRIHILPKALLFVFILLCVGGCRTSFKQNFRDFRAHYNTYYNAQKSFETGLAKNDAQDREYNPFLPIRIHQRPVNAGNEDFQKTIDKGADVLRKYDASKWVDDAIELIGKSYYYRQEYFSADQKFQELYAASTNNKLKQSSVYWRGRTYLELELHQEAINYLSEQLVIFDENWNRTLEAETRAVLAEHLIELGNFAEAEEELKLSIEHLSTKAHRSRGHFLYGQVLERNGKLGVAFEAYAKVEKYYQDYDLLFQANIRKGQIARQLGNWEVSYDIFYSMSRDDKNLNEKSELDYELAKTIQEKGDFEEAEDIYYSVLYDNISNPSRETIAKTYYGLADINKDYYNDFALAAAYYDSSAQQRIDPEKLPSEFNANELAASFGEYSRLTSSIHTKDSLIWLGSLPQEQLDSVVLEQKKLRREEILKQLREEEQRRNTLVNVSGGNRVQQAQTGQRKGFLNYKSPVQLIDAQSQFQAIWGDRPLVDNWRRLAVIRVSLSDSSGNDSQGNGANSTSISSISLDDIQIDLSEVPFTAGEKDSMSMEMAEEMFQLGNLFFLSLEMPDSAAYYFEQVIRDYPTSDVVPITYYSLSELKITIGDNDRARDIADELITKFPDTIYAQRQRERYNIPYNTDISEAGDNEGLSSLYFGY